ncbi:MAG: biotin/lipoyl-binding protein, partial [Methylococcaceae bacterium]|nr:biotin/lipoyl-binding protein [Methylococcaceae bacterium]
MTELQSSPRKPCIKLISLSLGLWLAISLTGCDQNTQQPASKQGNQPNKPAEMPAIPVKTVLPIHREVLEWDEYTGRIEAMESVDIRARVSGYLEQVLFRDGGKVKKGDLLFVIDRRNYE